MHSLQSIRFAAFGGWLSLFALHFLIEICFLISVRTTVRRHGRFDADFSGRRAARRYFQGAAAEHDLSLSFSLSRRCTLRSRFFWRSLSAPRACHHAPKRHFCPLFLSFNVSLPILVCCLPSSRCTCYRSTIRCRTATRTSPRRRPLSGICCPIFSATIALCAQVWV